ncbi:hypothetical protein ES332_D10G180000v1 [Gossypium tomentosum]|uniref:Secreted protein n=1 Tax=Gossypium tomentosum TaxID=34277 RepID=A0A5D2J561_GOSTO|nr:hypothetical protein ES332_D10G180000v1 [Gossypium tomentosum]TYH50079.1 hypothetical protein ES332_D10G180000v1 [Gossypium tomentosum]
MRILLASFVMFYSLIYYKHSHIGCRVKGRVVQVAGREKISCSQFLQQLMDMSFLAMDLKLALQIMQQLIVLDSFWLAEH